MGKGVGAKAVPIYNILIFMSYFDFNKLEVFI